MVYCGIGNDDGWWLMGFLFCWRARCLPTLAWPRRLHGQRHKITINLYLYIHVLLNLHLFILLSFDLIHIHYLLRIHTKINKPHTISILWLNESQKRSPPWSPFSMNDIVALSIGSSEFIWWTRRFWTFIFIRVPSTSL